MLSGKFQVDSLLMLPPLTSLSAGRLFPYGELRDGYSTTTLRAFRGNATAFASSLIMVTTASPGRLNSTSHVANVLAAFSRPGGLQFALNTTVDTASAAAFRASTPLLGSEVRQLLPPPPLQYACLGYDPSWMSSYGTQDRDVLAFLNSSSAVSKSGSGGLPVWGRAADRQELERCAGTGEVVQVSVTAWRPARGATAIDIAQALSLIFIWKFPRPGFAESRGAVCWLRSRSAPFHHRVVF